MAKKKLNFMHGFKSAILAIFQFWQNGTFEPVHEIQIFFCQKISFEALWRCHLQIISLTCSRVRQIQDLGQLKYKTEIFSQRTHKISKILFNLGSYESLESLESKIRRCPFFDVHNRKKTVWTANEKKLRKLYFFSRFKLITPF